MIQVLMRLFGHRVVRSPPAPLRVLSLAAALLLYGSTGFLYFELPNNPQLTWLDGFWYSFVTVTTVGYGDLYPSTPGGRFIVGVPLMFFGIGLLGYVLSIAATALVEAKTKELHGMSDFKLKDHLVILNFPGVGKLLRVLDELAHDERHVDRDVVLIDEDLAELPAELHARGVRFVRGNPARDATLSRASVDTAAYALVLSRDPGNPRSDERNVAITLALEARSSSVHSVVECVDFSTQELLRKAGCDGIVCTSHFDAHFLGAELMNPGVQEVIDQLTTTLRGQQIYLTPYESKKEVLYSSLASACQDKGHLAIGVRRGAETLINVESGFKLKAGDRLISIGTERLSSLD